MYLCTSNANDKDITNEKNRDSKTEITIHNDPSDKRKDSVHVEEMVHNKPGDKLVVSGQILNKNVNNSSNNIFFFGDSIPKGINIKNLKRRLYNDYWSCCFFAVVASKHFHHYIYPTLNEMDVIMDFAVLHMGTNDIINSEFNKDFVADSIINIARACVAFDAKGVFISSMTVNTRHNSAAINAVNKTLKTKFLMHTFYFMDNSNIKKKYVWKDSLHLKRSGKDLTASNFL